jgi:beta-N-acetylhexosaminidase
VLGAELRACGVDLSFTPVLDLDFGESSVIGDRSFGRDPRIVALLAQALMHGLRTSGMGNCGKHFPGHGFVKADSHHAIPVDRRSLKAILAEDAAPYGWLSASLDAVMPAHVIYPKVDSRPAGFSSRWLQDVLRHRLGFTGAIFSDDLSMEAARHIDGRAVSFTEAALAALAAGRRHGAAVQPERGGRRCPDRRGHRGPVEGADQGPGCPALPARSGGCRCCLGARRWTGTA